MGYEENYILQKKPWKVWMTSAPNPTAVLASARSLLQGTSLNHNILIYNGNLYANGVFSGTQFIDFFRYYIDVEPALFDRRHKSGSLQYDITEIVSNLNVTDISSINVNLYNKDAALYPENIKSQFGVNSDWNGWFHCNSNLSSEQFGISYNISDCFTADATGGDINYFDSNADIICYQRDETFANIMSFEDGKDAYTKIKLNQRTTMVMKLIVEAIFFNSDHPELIRQVNNNNATILFSKIINDNAFNHILDYIYFWVKAPFCADYIDPDDFNQNLNQDANVVHRNLLVSSNYIDKIRNNFNRYNAMYNYEIATNQDDPTTVEEFLERYSRPYIPTNSPLKDFVSDDLAKIEGVIDYDFNNPAEVATAAEKLIANSYIADVQAEVDSNVSLEKVLGSVLSLPVRTVGSETRRITPFNFYDPDSREDIDYYTALGRIPTLIGKDGNIVTDGRILSPTIDEIWYIVKKIISGEPIKDTIPTNIALPNNEIANIDTTLKEVIKAQYKQSFDGVSHSIDPIDFKYTFDSTGKIDNVEVKEYVVQPEKISHKIYNLLNVVSSRINTFYKNNVDFDDTFNTDENNETTYVGNSKELNRVGDYILGTTKMDIASSGDNEYGPRRSAPLSLRELEAAILGNKYNLENNFVFASKTYSVTGKFGKQLKDEEGNIISGGSLYQMHRDYNADVENPNTYFELGGKGDGASGYDITAGDLNGEIEKNGDILVYLLDEKQKRTARTNRTKLPIMVEHYGVSDLLSPIQGEYTGADIYMAADGTWRYKLEHMRLPILRSRY